ncbi:MAG: hypothetical protein PHY92_01115 [Alphaproteobacteria bacterium]|nr:hypothetical protein [Alphaproteobacteria bacterium]
MPDYATEDFAAHYIACAFAEGKKPGTATGESGEGNPSLILKITNESPFRLDWLTVEVIALESFLGSDPSLQSVWKMSRYGLKGLDAGETAAIEVEGSKHIRQSPEGLTGVEVYRLWGKLHNGPVFEPECSRRLEKVYGKIYMNKPPSPCFVTTAAFGDPMHPMVCTFRDVRDEIFPRFRLGRLFKEGYTRYGPALARLIDKHEARKTVARALLKPLAHTTALARRVIDTSPRLSSFVYGLRQG